MLDNAKKLILTVYKESKRLNIPELSLKSNEALPGWSQNTDFATFHRFTLMEPKTYKVVDHHVYI